MPHASIDSIVAMYASWGSEKYDEEVTQLAHALQCAALAARDGATNELIAAALLHDIASVRDRTQQRPRPPH